MKKTLWTKNFTLVTVSSALGAVGGIAGGFALSFLVFDETGSTLASALILAIQLVPFFILPLFLAPIMDRLPRKPFLVAGDLVDGVLYALMGLYLLKFKFSYSAYLAYSLLLACLESFDELAFQSIYPKLIPEGMEQQGYAVSTTLYPILRVIMLPLAGLLLDAVGAAWILIGQGGLSLLAALIESNISIKEHRRAAEGKKLFSLRQWYGDIREAADYLKNDRGVTGIFSYMAVTNGVSSGYSSILVAFFRTFPGFTAAMYSLFSVFEFAGRTLGGAVQYKLKLANEKKFGFTFMVYQIYELMDMCLLWLPYPLMLANRALVGFLGANSATMRQAAMQSYIPEALRARLNAFQNMLVTAASGLFALLIGALGEVLDYRLCVTLCGATAFLAAWLLVWRRRVDVRKIFEYEKS